MQDKILSLCVKYRAFLSYGFFGVLATIVNYVVYLAWITAFPGQQANVAGTCVAWVLSVLFAYYTNRKWVFASKVSGFVPQIKECASFFAARLFSGLVDLGIMYMLVDVWGYDGKIIKLLSNILVIILNYILSKLIVFKKS